MEYAVFLVRDGRHYSCSAETYRDIRVRDADVGYGGRACLGYFRGGDRIAAAVYVGLRNRADV